METFISIQEVSRYYESNRALNNISIDINKGELCGVLGPDGSGKTTLFRIITTLIFPTSGKVTIEDMDVVVDYKSVRKIIGYMPGMFSLYHDLSVEENLQFFATIFGTSLKENYDLIKPVYQQIEPFKTRRAGRLSGGMKQKLALCCALIHKPRLLILDEPTTGVDAVSRLEFWEILKSLKKYGITIMISTPYMDEAQMCERVALMQNGTLLAFDQPENIIRKFNKKLFAVKTKNMYRLLQDLRNFPGESHVYAFGQYAHFVTDDERLSSKPVHEYLEGNNHENIVIKTVTPTIEDCFIDRMKIS